MKTSLASAVVARWTLLRMVIVLSVFFSMSWNWRARQVPGFSVFGQTPAEKKLQPASNEKEASKVSETDLLAAQRRAFALSLVTSLADEAGSYHDLTLRPRVLARAADTLWGADTEMARRLFRRAWEAAEKADAPDAQSSSATNENTGMPAKMQQVVAAMRGLHGDARMEVLSLVARRDRALGEEFLKKLQEATKREAADSRVDSSLQNIRDNWSGEEAAARRLQVARRLLDEGQIDQAVEFATPALDQVNVNSIGFLSALREKRPDVADQRFMFLLTRAEYDPLADANTVSGLSSYAFSPNLYVTFGADGSFVFGNLNGTNGPPPSLPPPVRERFFRTTGNILLRPLPPPDQDRSSAGRNGKYMAIKRLLPLFDHYARDIAVALRTQLAALATDLPKKITSDDNLLPKQVTKLDDESNQSSGDVLQTMQDRLDHAKTSRERDSIFEEASLALTKQGDSRARDVAERIDDSDLRTRVRQYVDFEFLQLAVRKKNASEVASLAKRGDLTHTQRVWGYTQAARLLVKSQSARSLELMEEGVAEARRIDGSDPDRARSLIAVATQFVDVDGVRAWEILNEAVKAANAAEKFTGEDIYIVSRLMTNNGFKIRSVRADDFSLAGIVELLAWDDLYRSVDLAKSFTREGPRAVATLAIASTLLRKPDPDKNGKKAKVAQPQK